MKKRVKEKNNSIKKGYMILSNNKKIDLEKRFNNYIGKNHALDFKWDDSMGKEIW